MNVKDLYHIYQIGKEEKRNKLEILDTLSEKSKEKHLIKAIQQATQLDDELVAKQSLNTDARDKYFRKLRLKLKKRLLNSLLFLNVDDQRFPSLEAVEYESEKMLLQAKVLYREDALAPAEKLLLEIQKNVERLELHYISFEVCRLLKNLYARKADLRKYEMYDLKSEQLKQKLDSEHKIVNFFKLVQLHYRHSVEKREHLLSQHQEWEDHLKHIYKPATSLKADMLFLRTRMTLLLLEGKYEQVLKEYEEHFDQYLKAFKKGIIDKLGVLIHYKLSALLALGRIEEGSTLCLKYMELYREYREESFRFIEYFLLFSLNAKNLVRSRLFCNSMLGPHYEYQLDERAKERWIIFRAYIRFAEVIENPGVKKDLFSNEELHSLPVYIKDKKGYNFYIQLLLCIQQLLKKEVDLFGSKVESLKVYASRHLKGNNRARLFIRLLNGLNRESFDAEKCRKKFKNLLQELKEAPVSGLAYTEHEVIRYELLWEMVLKFIEREKVQ